MQFGWIDYSSEHRKKVMAVLDALSAPGAVDELGIGQIRDGFANKLFPGTSTLQTRAKYFFIVPYILMELEKRQGLSPKSLLGELERIEGDIIDLFKNKGNIVGYIGENSGRNIKRKPSSIYWSGLRVFGFFRHPSLSIEGYARYVCSVNQEMLNQIMLGKRLSDDNQNDDEDAHKCLSVSGLWYCLPPPEEKWLEKIDIELSRQEAEYLKSRITKSEHSKDSLLAFMSNCDAETVRSIDRFSNIGSFLDIPFHIKQEYEMARRFSDFVYGANIRYNVILTDRQNKKPLEMWDDWVDSFFVKQSFASYNADEAMNYLRINNPRLRRFLNSWKENFLLQDEEAIDDLIIKREIELKGRERAKIRNPEYYTPADSGTLVGGKLNYRFGNVYRLLDDIFSGLEELHA